MDLDSIGKLKKEELVSLCKEKNLKISGNKSDLVTRLLSGEVQTKRKRPDLVLKATQQEDSKPRVIKKSLAGTLRTPQLYPVIEKWVSEHSKNMNRASLVFNRYLIHYLSNGLELPNFNGEAKEVNKFFNHCFKTGLRKSEFGFQTIWDTYFSEFPVHKPREGDFQTLTWAVKTYVTVFNNSLEFNFESRQKRYIRHWLETNNLDKSWIHSIRCAVNGWNCRTEPPSEARDFILSQRQILNPPEKGIDQNWLKKHRNSILQYFWVILEFLEPIETARKFNLAPIHTLSSHFLLIDPTILFYMSREAGILPKDVSEKKFRLQKEDYFRRIFKFKESERYKFNYHIKTDGVSVCFEYQIPNLKTPEVSKDEPIQSYERTIGIDPGRSNIIFGVEKTPEGLQTYRLTRKEYYCASGMTKRNKQASKWQEEIRGEEEIFSQFSPKTTNARQWDSFLRNYISVYDRLWEVKTGKKWARARFRVFGLKKKTLDRFFKRMEGSVKPIILYGSAKFNPNGRNEISAPTTSIYKTCQKRFKVELVDEFRTTRVCENCDKALSPVLVHSKKLGKYKEIRGLRRCGSSECSQTSYKNRDLNAALNILRCHSIFPRPQILSREPHQEVPKEKPWVLRHARR
jgi:hypothetical protein